MIPSNAGTQSLMIGGMPFERIAVQTEHVRPFAMAQFPTPNFVWDNYIPSMGRQTHGIVTRRRTDGKPIVLARCEEDGRKIKFRNPRNTAEEALWRGAGLLNGDLVRLVPQAERYKEMLGEELAAHFIGPNVPGTLVTPYEIIGLADRLTQESGIEVGLPTNIQWEYANKKGEKLGLRRDPSELISNNDGVVSIAPGSIDREDLILNSSGLADMRGHVWQPTLFEGPVTDDDDFKIMWLGGSLINLIELGFLGRDFLDENYLSRLYGPDHAHENFASRLVALLQHE